MEPSKHEVVSQDGCRIAYWQSGEGRPLVLVHGTMVDHSCWDLMRPFLEPHLTVYAMDRRGRGGSGDRDPYSVEREFEDVVAVVEQAARDHGSGVDLFGHSMGAFCALEAARLSRDLRRLVLYEPVVLAPEGSTGFAERAEALLAVGDREAVVEILYRDVLGLAEEEIAKMRRDPSWASRVAGAHTLPREDRVEATYRWDPRRFGDLSVPTLMLTGGDSPAFLGESARAVVGALPDARIFVLEGQMHRAVVDAPQVVAQAVLSFLMDQQGASPGA